MTVGVARPGHLEQITWFHHLNVYLLATPAGPVLVDAAAPGMLGWLRRKLRRFGLQPSDLAGVLLTHFHRDHAGTAPALARMGVPIHALDSEIPILAGRSPHPGYGGRGGKLLLAAEQAALPPLAFRDVQPVSPGQRVFGTAWEVVPVPGHTPGSLALFHPHTGDLLSGDTLVCDLGWPRGPHPLFTPDYPRAVQSALHLLDLGARYVHPGHGRSLPVGAYDRVRARLAGLAVLEPVS